MAVSIPPLSTSSSSSAPSSSSSAPTNPLHQLFNSHRFNMHSGTVAAYKSEYTALCPEARAKVEGVIDSLSNVEKVVLARLYPASTAIDEKQIPLSPLEQILCDHHSRKPIDER